MSSDVAKTQKGGRIIKTTKTTKAETHELPRYIREWHELVEKEPKRFCEDIKQLKTMIEGLLVRDDIWYDDTDVEAFIEFARLFRHQTGRWAGEPLELSIEQRYIVACVFGLKTYDEELDLEVRYFTELVLLVGRKWGKALALDTPVNTPDGWRTIGDITVGDYVFDDMGKPTRVTHVSEVFTNHVCYRVTFEDGESIIADADHQWQVMTKCSRHMVNRQRISDRKLLRPDYHDGNGYFTTTTAEMAGGFKRVRPDGKGTEYKYRVPMAAPVEYPEAQLPLHPYVFGVWLGDGYSATATVTTSDEDRDELLDNTRACGVDCHLRQTKQGWVVALGKRTYTKGNKHRPENQVLNALRGLGVIESKHIPQIYLRASTQQRMALLQGLMDTDGYVDQVSGYCEFVQKNEAIARGVQELLSSLGIKHTTSVKIPRCNGKLCDPAYRIKFFVDKSRTCFRLRRKHERLKDKLSPRMRNKSIVNIERVESVPTKCIAVESPSHLFLVGKTNTVTHNSTFISSLAAWMLMADREPSAQVWCLATKKAQAAIVYDNTKALLRSSEVMTPPDNPWTYWRTRRDRDNTEMILFPATNSYMKPAGKNSQNQDGLNPHCFVIDECHAVRDRNTYDVFSSATGARTQPLGIIISTFGFVRESIFDSILKRCEDRLTGQTDERLFPMIFRIDKTDDPADRSCWIKANPGLPEARPTMRYLEGEYQKALADPAQLPSFLAKHLNRAASSSVVYFNLHEVDQCAIDLSIDIIRDTYAVGGIDASETTDLTCATALIPKDGRFYIFQRYFIAEQRIEQNSKQDQMAYESFTRTNATDPIHQELLKISLGSMVSTEDIAEWYAWLAEEFGVTFWKIGSDRWHFNEVSKNLAEKGFMREDREGIGVTFSIPWGSYTLSEPMKQTRVLFRDRVFVYSRHNGLLRWCVTNVSAKVDANNNVMPDRRASKARIDGYASLLAAYVAYLKVKDDFAVYQK